MPINHAYVVPHPPLIIPEVGRGEQQKIQHTIDAYTQIGQSIAEIKPETVIVITPHSVMYGDYIHISPGENARGDFSRFGAPQVKFSKQYDTEYVSTLCEEAKQAGIPAGTLGERDSRLDHGTMIPLYFIDSFYSGYKIVRISISGLSALDHYRFGVLLSRASERLNRSTAIIASGDLSHKLVKEGPYGFAKEGPEFDAQLTEALKAGDFMRLLRFDEAFTEAAAECGLRSFIEMAGAFDGRAVESEFMSYEGPFGVGYAVCAFTASGMDAQRKFADKIELEERICVESITKAEDTYVQLARFSLAAYLKNGKHMARPEGLPKEMLSQRAGVFVSIKKYGRLRGCIGTISATEPCIADEIIRNAVSAGTGDPRFDPITANEFPDLVFSVDVLGDAESISSLDELDVKRYGVIVRKGYRSGLLLPNLDGVDTPEQQVSIALQKAGIAPDEKYSLERFEVVRHK